MGVSARDDKRSLGAQRVVLLLTPVLAVGAGLLFAWLVLVSLAWPLHGAEMAAAAIINLAAGVMALVPTALVLGKDQVTVARMALLSIALRLGLVLLGFALALGPGWHLDRMALVAWLGGCYMVLLVSESVVLAWVMRRGSPS